MYRYVPPIRDMLFTLQGALDAPGSWRTLPAFRDLEVGAAEEILTEAGKFSAQVLQPLNADGDRQGCALEDSGVRTPPGFRAAYRAYIDGGWPTLSCDATDGGQGLPLVLLAAFNEMVNSCNHGWAMYPTLAHGAYECIKTHASPALRERYLPQLVSGECLAAMALTEPQAGSDLGLVRTQAEPQADGSVRVTGGKIFISGGDHDLTDNIVHLTLCRLPNAPAGSKGLSLALIPKILPDGARNAMRCTGLEHKMGIHGSATCAMQYEGATGWLIGEPHRGLQAMFVMMNAARLMVGVQGLGHLEMATQNALRYAQERRQMRAPIRSSPERPTDAIVAHPAVRRTLATLTALIDGGRTLAYWAALLLDEAHHHPDAAQRAEAHKLASLLTPVVKAFLSECGHRGADEALQLWGGYGFLRDYGVEQTVRDSRIALIYEGVNEIQAIDLLIRKTLDDRGQGMQALLGKLLATTQGADSSLAQYTQALQLNVDAARTAIGALLEGAAADAEWPYRVADDYLRALGYTLMTWAWTRIALAVGATDRTTWHEHKLSIARFGVEQLAPLAQTHWRRVLAREASLPTFPTEL